MARRRQRTAARAERFAPRLVIMAKSPRAGRVKRRLAAEIGDSAAIRFYRTCLANSLRRLSNSSRWRTLLAVTPDADVKARLFSTHAHVQRLAQGRGDLGARMQRLFEVLPPGPVLIVGSDVPAVSQADIAQAFHRLGRADAVFGPAADGGYWLIGVKRSRRLASPFRNVRWGSAYALADTLANLTGKRIALAATLSDVDTAEDYRRERASWQRLIPPRRG
jgi:rSAM/selenodomain-associated transferase 1